MENELENLLCDVVAILREKAAEAKMLGAKGDQFQQGRNFGLYEVLSLLKDQAMTFAIDPKKIGFAAFEPDQSIL